MIRLKELSEKYGYGEGHFRVILCRPEFNEFRLPCSNYFIFDGSEDFHKKLKSILDLKKLKKCFILFCFLWLGCKTAWCQQYEPVIIYNQYGESQLLLKGRIIYDDNGVPKTYIQTKTSMPRVHKK